MITITHTAAEGTLLHGTAAGDGTNTTLKASGWRWSRTLGAWYLPNSRDHAPDQSRITRTAELLTAEGQDVSVDLNHQARSTAEVETDRIARQNTRVEALGNRAALAEAAADRASDRADELSNRWPLGQPILTGHHSERRHRRDLDRSHRAMDQSIQASQAANEARTAHEAAAATTDRRYNPETVSNRVERLGAEIRQLERQRDGHTRTVSRNADGTRHIEVTPAASEQRRAVLDEKLAELRDQLTYWTEVRQQQAAKGQVIHGPDTTSVGDMVNLGHDLWRKVLRVNRKTVTVPSGYSWNDTVPFQRIKAVKRNQQ